MEPYPSIVFLFEEFQAMKTRIGDRIEGRCSRSEHHVEDFDEGPIFYDDLIFDDEELIFDDDEPNDPSAACIGVLLSYGPDSVTDIANCNSMTCL
jgi:hypothetical protein